MSKRLVRARKATHDTYGVSVNELIAYARKVWETQPDAVMETGHLNPWELIKFRMSDPTSFYGQRRDDQAFGGSFEAGAMKGSIHGGSAEGIEAHGLNRYFDLTGGSSVGGVAAAGVAHGTASQGADMQMHLCGKPYDKHETVMKYVHFDLKNIRKTLGRIISGQPLLSGSFLHRMLRDEAPLAGNFMCPSFVVMSRKKYDEEGNLHFVSQVETLHDKTPDERADHLVGTMRVPAAMHMDTQDDLDYDGAGTEALPLKTMKEAGATKILAFRTNKADAKVDGSILPSMSEKLSASLARKGEFTALNLAQSMGSSRADPEMLKLWISGRDSQKISKEDLEGVEIVALPNPTVEVLTTDEATIIKNRIAAFYEFNLLVEKNLGLPHQPNPAAWDKFKDILGVEHIDQKLIYEEVMTGHRPFDASKVEDRNNPQYERHMDRLIESMFDRPQPAPQRVEKDVWGRYKEQEPAMAGQER